MNKRKIYIHSTLVLMFSLITSGLFSQSIKAEVDRDKILIGEQIKIKLSVQGGNVGMSWFNFPDSIPHLEIVQKGKIDTVANGAATDYYQIISITSFDSGAWEFPPLFINGVNQSTPAFNISVLPVDVSQMQDYNDIKDIEEVQMETNWLIIAFIAALTLFSIGMVYWLIKKKKNAVVVRPSLRGNLSPLDWALAELNKLSQQQVQTPSEVKKYYSDLTSISRTFFNMQLQQQSFHQTTDEWMIALQPLSVDNETRISFFQFLRLADTVKFAKYQPPASENQTSPEIIKRMLQKVSLLHSNIYSNYQPK